MGISFGSTGEYFRFIGAKEFRAIDNGEIFPYDKNILEKIGEGLSKPLLSSTDAVTRNIRKPLFVTAVATAVIVMLTLVFYPSTFAGVVGRAIQPWIIKFGCYLALQTTVLGVGIRAIGRLRNETIIAAWNEKRIFALQIGMEDHR